MEEPPASWADIAARTTIRRARASFRVLGAGAVVLTVLPWLSDPSSAQVSSVTAAGWEAAGERTTTNTMAPVGPVSAMISPPSLVASSSAPVSVRNAPRLAAVTRLLDPADQTSGHLVFLVKENVGEWLQVYLPVRPNGSTGWIRRSDVELSQHRYRIELELTERRLKLFRADQLIMEEPIGVGAGSTPTPGGVYYLKELLRPPDPDGFYGPYAYGLSGFSNTLADYRGGEGVIGIHGTDDPSSVGRSVSHGCVRLRNDAIVRLAEEIGLPLGTPVIIEE